MMGNMGMMGGPQEQDTQEMLRKLMGGGMRSSMPGMEWWRLLQNPAVIQNILRVGVNRAPQQGGGGMMGGIGDIIGRGGGGSALPAPGGTRISLADIANRIPGGIPRPGGMPNMPLQQRRPML